MAKCGVTNVAGGGGIGSDELSATANKVVEGNTYVGADTNDEIGTGTLVDRPSTVSAQSVAQGLSGGSNYIFTRIPTGAYRTPTSVGYPEITALSSTVASAGGLSADKMLAGKTAFGINGTATSDANATTNHVLKNKTVYVNGAKLIGSMPDYSTTPTPIDAIRINNNRFEVAVAAGYHGYSWAGNGYEYMSYDQVANAIGLTPAKLKKGEWVCGRTGTWEGWVPTVKDLYLRGNNVAGFVSSDERNFKFETAQITISGYHVGSWGGSSGLRLKNFDLTKSSSLNMEFSVTIADKDSPPRDMTLYIVKPGSGSYGNPLGAAKWSFANLTTNQVLSINTTALQEVVDIVVYIYHVDTSGYRGYITRIWTT